MRFDTRSTRNKSTINNNNNTADSNNSYKRKVEGSSVNNALANINHDGKLIPYESQNTLASLERMSTFQNNIILKSIGIDNPYVSRSIIRQLIAETVDCVAKKSYKRIQPNFELITMDQNKIIKINAPVKAVSDEVYDDYIRKLEAEHLAAENRATIQHTIDREAAEKIYIQDRVGLVSYNSLRNGFVYPPYVPKAFVPPPKIIRI